jgi:drug/metabolite transporter (DMT)-like permease
MKSLNTHIILFIGIILAGLSQIIVRWQMSKVSDFPEPIFQRLLFFITLLFKPWILVAAVVTVFSAICWMITLMKFELSYAYPWTSLLYLYMLVAGYFLFGDVITAKKILGSLVIVLGVVLVAR